MGKLKTFTCSSQQFEKDEDAFKSAGSPSGIRVPVILCDECQEKVRREKGWS